MSGIVVGMIGRRHGMRESHGAMRRLLSSHLLLWSWCRATTSAVVIAVVITGCGRGPKTAPVSGLVTLDGKPVAGAAVLFMPVEGGVPGRAATKDDGSFSLSTFQERDGALVGRHRVAVTKVETTGLTAGADGVSGKLDGRQIRTTWLTPQRYGAPATSGLEATVEKGVKNAFEFRLTSD